MLKVKFSFFVFLYSDKKSDSEPAASFETFEAAKAFALNHKDQGAKVIEIKPSVVFSIYEPSKI